MSTIEGSGSGGMMGWSSISQGIIRDTLQELGAPGGMMQGSDALQTLASKNEQVLGLSVQDLVGGNVLGDAQTVGAAVVGQTLGNMNSDPITGAKDSNSAFQEQVLGAHAGLGILVNKNG